MTPVKASLQLLSHFLHSSVASRLLSLQVALALQNPSPPVDLLLIHWSGCATLPAYEQFCPPRLYAVKKASGTNGAFSSLRKPQLNSGTDTVVTMPRPCTTSATGITFLS